MRPRPRPITRQRTSLAAAAISDRLRTVIRAGAARCSPRGRATARYSSPCIRRSAAFPAFGRGSNSPNTVLANEPMVDYETKRPPSERPASSAIVRTRGRPNGGTTKTRPIVLSPAMTSTRPCSFRPCKPPADPCRSRVHGCACSILRSVARHPERTRARPGWNVRVLRRCVAPCRGASRTPNHPSSGPGRAPGQRCSARAWLRVRQTSRRRRRAEEPGAQGPRQAGDGRWRPALFLAPLVPIPTAVLLRRRRGRRQ